MSVSMNIHEVESVSYDIRSYARGEMTKAFVTSTIHAKTRQGPCELAFFADEREQLGILGAEVMTAEQVVELVLSTLDAAGPLEEWLNRRDAANNIAQALQGVWVKL